MAADLSTKADLPSAWLIRFSPYLKTGTRVLEIASGNGRNTRFLVGLGCDVTAADINPVPEPLVGVQYIQRDLEKEDWFFAPESFDAVIGINYLWRDRFDALCSLTEPGGFFLYETFTRHQTMLNFGPKNPQHFLQDRELLHLIPSDWHILAYEDGRADNDRYLQRIAAVKPRHNEIECLDVCARR